MKKSRYRNLLFFIFLAFLGPVFFCSFSVTAEASKEQTFDILLKEDSDIEQVCEDILEKDEKIKIQKYEDINLLHIIYPETLQLEDIIQDKCIGDEIAVAGEMPKLEEPEPVMDESMLSGITPESEELSGERDSGDDLFDRLAWHVDEVTDDRKSMKLSTGKGVRVALIDSGVDADHPALAGKINTAAGKSYVEGDDSLKDFNTHGTATAGIIAQIAPDAVITPYKVMGAKDGESIWTIAAILDAVKDGNDVINLSLGTYKCMDVDDERIITNTFKRAIKYAENNNVAIFASSGNKGMDLDENYAANKVLHLPGEIRGVNTIAATWNGSEASYSNYGSCVDFCAPGGELVYLDGLVDLSAFIYIAYPTYIDNGLEAIGIPQGYSFSYGTSLSSAVATACYADIYSYGKEKYPYFQEDDAIELMSAGSTDLGDEGKDKHYGSGEIDIYRAISGSEPIYEGEVIKENEKTQTYRTGKLTTDYAVEEEYGDKYHVNVTLTNNTSATIHKWEIALNCEDEIEKIWDAKARRDDEYIIVSSAGYNQDIAAGGSVSFGFIAVKASSEDEVKFPSEVILTNRKYMIGPEDYEIDYKISSQWDEGFIANVTITNISDREISDWKMEFTYDATIENIWNASVQDKDDEFYSILNDGSNQNIASGESVTFGFAAAGSGEEQIENISLISITK